MKVLVVGASGKSGRAIVSELTARQHNVTAFVRKPPSDFAPAHPFVGNALDADAIRSAVLGHDAVVVALGISENAFRVRLRGPKHTPMHIRSIGTSNVIAAMRAHSVRKLVVQTAFGVGDTAAKLPPKWRLFFNLVLKPQIEDTAEQEQRVRSSDTDWVLIRPVSLTDSPQVGNALVSAEGTTVSIEVSRRTVAQVIADNVESNLNLRQCLSVSEAKA